MRGPAASVLRLQRDAGWVAAVGGAVAQLGERRPCKAEVVGSIPISSTSSWMHDLQVFGLGIVDLARSGRSLLRSLTIAYG